MVERKYPLKRKKSGTWKGEHEALCAYDSKVPCNDAEHGESLGNIDIANTFFAGLLWPSVGEGELDAVAPDNVAFLS